MLTQMLCSCYSKESSTPPANIVAVDLQPMAPLEGVTSIRGDITSVSTAKRVIAATGGEKSQLVICDGAPDVTGLHTLDAYLQAQLLLAAFSITIHLLAPGGWFIAKIFRTTQDPRAELLVSQMRCFFPEKPNDEGGVWIRKPRSSREGSGGAFRPLLLCLRVTLLTTLSSSTRQRPSSSVVTFNRSPACRCRRPLSSRQAATPCSMLSSTLRRLVVRRG